MTDETTNQADTEVDYETEGVATGVDSNPETDEQEVDQTDDEAGDDADTLEGGEGDDDADEIEFEGVKAKVPKALADAIAQGALRHKDYTQKTQQVAEERRALESREAEITQRAEVYKANIAKVAQLHQIDADLTALNDVTPEQWEAIKKADIDNYRDLKDQHRELKEARAALQGELDSAEAEAKRQAEEASTKEFSAARQAMGRALFGVEKAADGLDLAIPGLTPQNAPQVFAKIETFATKALGITPAELAQVTDARILKGLHMAMEAVQSASVKKSVAKVEATQKTQPARKVGGAAPHARRTTDSSGDGLSDEEWIRRENERLASKRRR